MAKFFQQVLSFGWCFALQYIDANRKTEMISYETSHITERVFAFPIKHFVPSLLYASKRRFPRVITYEAKLLNAD